MQWLPDRLPPVDRARRIRDAGQPGIFSQSLTLFPTHVRLPCGNPHMRIRGAMRHTPLKPCRQWDGVRWEMETPCGTTHIRRTGRHGETPMGAHVGRDAAAQAGSYRPQAKGESRQQRDARPHDLRSTIAAADFRGPQHPSRESPPCPASLVNDRCRGCIAADDRRWSMPSGSSHPMHPCLHRHRHTPTCRCPSCRTSHPARST